MSVEFDLVRVSQLLVPVAIALMAGFILGAISVHIQWREWYEKKSQNYSSELERFEERLSSLSACIQRKNKSLAQVGDD